MANVNKIKQMAERHEYNLAVDILDSQDLERSLNPQFLRSCAEIYENVGRLKEARQLYIKAHSMAPVANRIIFSIINFYLKRGFSSLAARYYEEYEANDTGLSGDFSEANYIMKKAVPVDLSVLHDMLYPRFRDQMDENWSFELFLVLCLMGKREEYMILGSDYLATFKEGLYNQAIQDILLGDEKAETYFYIYPKDEVHDKDPEEEDIRSREIEVLKADYLRRNPQNSEAYITEMYDDEKPAPKFRNKKKKSSAEPEYDENGNLIEPENGEVDEATRSRNEAVERRLKSFIRKKFLKGKAAAKTDDNVEEAALNPDGTAAETAMAGIAAATDAAAAGMAASAEGASAVNASAEGTAVDQTDASGTTETKSENVGATEFIKGIFNIRPTGTNKSDMKEIKPEKEFISYDFDDGFAPESESIYDLDKEEEEAFENPFDSISAYRELERYKQNAELDFRKSKESVAAENEVEEKPVVEETGYGTEETSYPVSVPASYEEEYTSEYEDSDEYSDFDYSDIDEEYLSVTTEFISSLTDEELASMTDEELAAAIEKVFAPKIEDRSKFNDLSEPFYEVGKESSEETDTESADEIHNDSSYDEEAELVGEEPRYDEEAELVGEEPQQDKEAEPEYDEEAELIGEPILSSGFDYTSLFGRELEREKASESDVTADQTSSTAVESDVTDSYTYVEESADETSSGMESESSPISEHEIKVDVDIDSDNGFEAEFDTEAEAEENQDEDSTYSYSFKSSPEFSTIIGFDSELEFKQQLQSELESIDIQKPEPEPEPKEEPKSEPEVKTSIKYGLKTPFGTGSVFGTGTKSESEPVFGSGPSFGTEEKITFGPGLRPSFSSEDIISFKRETDSSVKPSAETVISEPLAEPEIKSETETVMESASETVKESVTETVFESTAEIFSETKSDTFGSPVTEEVTEPSVEVTVEPETQIYEKPEAEAYAETEANDEAEAEAIEESEDTVIIEPDIDDVIEAPSEGGTADVYEGETEPAYLMVKPRFEFPEFKTDLFPAVRQNFDIENKFDDIVNEKQSELDAKLKAEDEKMREAQELLASLGIEI